MPLTEIEVAKAEQGRSHYGCGSATCAACYPVQYACEGCGEDFASPIANGEVFTCEGCEWISNT
jgi:Zn-finger protein